MRRRDVPINVGELIELLRQCDPNAPVLLEGSVFTEPACGITLGPKGDIEISLADVSPADADRRGYVAGESVKP